MQPRYELYKGILASNKLLACLGEDGHLKNIFWPNKDAYSSQLNFSLFGFSVDTNSIWLDPERDSLKLEFFPNENILKSTWTIKHNLFSGAKVTRNIYATESALITKINLQIPKAHFEKQIELWHLSQWKIKGHNEFQTVYSENGEDKIFSFRENQWVGIFAIKENKFFFQSCRAVQNEENLFLGDIIDSFIKNKKTYRRIEMGNVMCLCSSQIFSIHDSTKNMEEKEFFIVYQFGENQADVENKINNLLTTDLNCYFNSSTPSTLYDTSLAVLKYLTHENGGIIAAPEFDFNFKYCGGYGYIWPRDAAFCALSLIYTKQVPQAKQVLKFLAKTQNETGDFFQRFDAQGQNAPAWCELQADQLGLVLYTWFRYLKVEQDEIILTSAKKGILKLIDDFSHRHSLQIGFDLWEEAYGHHFYAHICAHGALTEALNFFPDLTVQIKNAINLCESFCQHSFFIPNQNRFVRNIDMFNNRDLRADISLLACLFPFDSTFISTEIKISMFEHCREKLSQKHGVLRYEHDTYRQGNSWVLASFWLALSAQTLAKFDSKYLELAKDIFNKTLIYCNSCGLFPEQIDSNTGKSIWVVPLAWSHAFYLMGHATLKNGI